MPSIFIWKALHPNMSQQTVSYLSGSDWFLEEHETDSHSFSFIDQSCITLNNSSDITSVLVYHSKKMPNNWVGSDILEMIIVPYQVIKSDSFGTLEQIGEWLRFISNEDTELVDNETLINEMNTIIAWMNTTHLRKHDNYEKSLINFTQSSEYNPKQHHIHKKYKQFQYKSYDKSTNK